jgi:hypothetical protein
LFLPGFPEKGFDEVYISCGDHGDNLFFYNFKINIQFADAKE